MKRNDHLGRRNFYRMKVSYMVNYKPHRSDESYSYTLTKNISAGGILVMSEKNFPKGTVMDVIISLPMYPNKRLNALAEVTSDLPEDAKKPLYPIRMRFVEFDNIAFEKLKDFIAKQMNQKKNGKTLKERLDRRQK